ncbi:MAG: response regulator [Myxococcota bacterium]
MENSDAKTKLLIVEDEPDIANALAIYGRKAGYEVLVASDGFQAIEIGIRERPAVVLLDISLPGMDGRDVMVRLQNAGVTKEAVVIFVTARDSQNDRLLGLELGADDYETKPLHFSMLFSKIARLLEKKQSGAI